MNNEKNNIINVVAQAYYGNKTATEIDRNKADRFVIGCLHDFPIDYPIDRTIVKIPNTENIVLVYNKYKEAEMRELKERALKEGNYVMKPLAVIAEENIEIYSRCIACRIDEHGELQSLLDEDYNKLIGYLAD